jgi:hypothetical protein
MTARSPRNASRRGLLRVGGAVALLGAGGALGLELAARRATAAPVVEQAETLAPGSGPSAAAGPHRFERLTAPARTVVRDADGNQLAVFTDRARTCLLTGPSRTWTEPRTTTAVITSDSWVRLMPKAWKKGRETSSWFRSWFPKVLGSTAEDLFAVAFQYEDGAPTKRDATGLRYAGDANFGPRVPGESRYSFHYRDEKSDFYDYLGIPWTFSDGTRMLPERARLGDLDCSGYMRMCFGYRLGYPMHTTNTPGVGLPRRAYAIAEHGHGVKVIPDTKRRPTDISRIQPGDLVFFAINIGKPLAIDHCGLYLGPDDDGHPRFLSSRSQANGPTFGDIAGAARLDGDGFYAEGLRTARRL